MITYEGKCSTGFFLINKNKKNVSVHFLLSGHIDHRSIQMIGEEKHRKTFSFPMLY